MVGLTPDRQCDPPSGGEVQESPLEGDLNNISKPQVKGEDSLASPEMQMPKKRVHGYLNIDH